MTASADALKECTCEIEYDLNWHDQCEGQIVRCDYCKAAPSRALHAAQIRVRQLLPNTDRTADLLDLQEKLAYSLGVLHAIKVLAEMEDEARKEEPADA